MSVHQLLQRILAFSPSSKLQDSRNLKTLEETEELFVVEHGKPGEFDNPAKNLVQPTMANKVIDALINPERGLPAGFRGTIQVTACWAGVGVDQTPSDICDGLREGVSVRTGRRIRTSTDMNIGKTTLFLTVQTADPRARQRDHMCGAVH